MTNKLTTTNQSTIEFINKFYAERIDPALADTGTQPIVFETMDEYKDAMIPASCILELAAWLSDVYAEGKTAAYRAAVGESSNIDELIDAVAGLSVEDPMDDTIGATASGLVQFVHAFAVQPATPAAVDPYPHPNPLSHVDEPALDDFFKSGAYGTEEVWGRLSNLLRELGPREILNRIEETDDDLGAILDEMADEGEGIPKHFRDAVDMLNDAGIECSVTNLEDGAAYGVKPDAKAEVTTVRSALNDFLDALKNS